MAVCDPVAIGLIEMVVVQFDVVHPSVTVQLMMEVPILNAPLALVPDPVRFVAPLIEYPTVMLPLQLVEAFNL